MAKEHLLYWLSTEQSGEDGVGRNWYYLKDARREARLLASKLKEDIYINQGGDIVEVVFAKK